MKELRSEFPQAGPVGRGDAVAAGGAALSGARVDRLLDEPESGPQLPESSSPPPMYGIWLGAVSGIAVWLALAATFLIFV